MKELTINHNPVPAVLEVGRRITKLRTTYGLTTQGFADSIGYTRPMVSYAESGKRLPTLSMAFMICHCYNVSLDWIFGPLLVAGRLPGSKQFKKMAKGCDLYLMGCHCLECVGQR